MSVKVQISENVSKYLFLSNLHNNRTKTITKPEFQKACVGYMDLIHVCNDDCDKKSECIISTIINDLWESL